MICSKCGFDNDNFQTVCSKCMNPLVKGFVMCPACGKIVKEGLGTCPRCKTNINIISVVDSNGFNENIAYTPKYAVRVPLSIPSIVSIMLYMVWSLIYNIYFMIIRLKTDYVEYSLKDKIIAILSKEYRIVVLLALVVLSIVTFIKRVSINKIDQDTELEKRLVTLKCLLLADVSSFFIYFLMSYYPSVWANPTTINIAGAVVGVLIMIISFISLPLFYKNASVKTR